jgi:hypothetical protein
MGAEPILKDGLPVGLTSSAAWLPASGTALVMGLVAGEGDEGWAIDLRGEVVPLQPHRANEGAA